MLFLDAAPAVQVDGSPVTGTKQVLPQISGLGSPSQEKHLGTTQDASPADSTWWSYTFGLNDGLRDVRALLKLRTIRDQSSRALTFLRYRRA